MSMHLEGSAQRLTIFCGESDKAAHSHKPLHVEIVQRARKSRLAGTTVLRGVEGFGASSVVHTTRFLSMSEDLPMVLVIVDTKERIQAFLPQLDDLIEEGLVIVEDVTVLKYVGRPDSER